MNGIIANLMVDDVNATVEYYKEHFGFEVAMSVDDKTGATTESGTPRLVWAMMNLGEASIMFQQADNLAEELPELKGKPLGGSFALYVSMADVKGLFDRVKDQLEVVQDLHKTWYGADEFVVRDLNGYFVYFAEVQS